MVTCTSAQVSRPVGTCPHALSVFTHTIHVSFLLPSLGKSLKGHPVSLLVTAASQNFLCRMQLHGSERQHAGHRGSTQERLLSRALIPRKLPHLPPRHLTVAGGHPGTRPAGAVDPPLPCSASQPAALPRRAEPSTTSTRALTVPLSLHPPFRKETSLHPGTHGFSPKAARASLLSPGPRIERCLQSGHSEKGEGGHVVGTSKSQSQIGCLGREHGPSALPPTMSRRLEGRSRSRTTSGRPGPVAGSGGRVPAGQRPAARRSPLHTPRGQSWRWTVAVAPAAPEHLRPRPRPRDGHALWPLGDSPTRRPRLSQAPRGSCAGRRRAPAFWTTFPGRPRNTRQPSGPLSKLTWEGSPLPWPPLGLQALWKPSRFRS